MDRPLGSMRRIDRALRDDVAFHALRHLGWRRHDQEGSTLRAAGAHPLDARGHTARAGLRSLRPLDPADLVHLKNIPGVCPAQRGAEFDRLPDEVEQQMPVADVRRMRTRAPAQPDRSSPTWPPRTRGHCAPRHDRGCACPSGQRPLSSASIISAGTPSTTPTLTASSPSFAAHTSSPSASCTRRKPELAPRPDPALRFSWRSLRLTDDFGSSPRSPRERTRRWDHHLQVLRAMGQPPASWTRARSRRSSGSPSHGCMRKPGPADCRTYMSAGTALSTLDTRRLNRGPRARNGQRRTLLTRAGRDDSSPYAMAHHVRAWASFHDARAGPAHHSEQAACGRGLGP